MFTNERVLDGFPMKKNGERYRRDLPIDPIGLRLLGMGFAKRPSNQGHSSVACEMKHDRRRFLGAAATTIAAAQAGRSSPGRHRLN